MSVTLIIKGPKYLEVCKHLVGLNTTFQAWDLEPDFVETARVQDNSDATARPFDLINKIHVMVLKGELPNQGFYYEFDGPPYCDAFGPSTTGREITNG